ncbi:3-hydroxybutyryl-CoA dehydrogenase [Microbacterium trichothecenolyticum]|uniref:3-hydroxyacyl-CoA dehydrogenase family protein n=1 Tax=Microbacterium trichothecenolyticum TaxID=69370 RepID=UPI0028616F31|nr:3-hydroxyacyl-CoA dehydrogenase family protein [Microbacterium trichothecenolyticum]MDR7187130.1 3-hydroxybutyryl-CoA dehydrogenase [Microbacterium trichothecenolyticum]
MKKIAVVGSGYMGGGIAQVLALSGAQVLIADVSAEVAERNAARLQDEAAQFEKEGLFAAGAADLIAANLRAAPSIEEAVADADFIEEAVPERLDIKHDALRRISAACPAASIIGSNTSTILISELATAVVGPERFLGVHFSNPAPFIPGVEIIAHAGTAEQAIARAEEFVAGTGKLPARVSDATGFVLNRLQYALFHEASQIVEEGIATADDVDLVVRTTFGFRLPFFGPFAIADMAGLDVYAMCYASLQTRWPERFATPRSLQQHVDAGRFGTKSGGGYLDIPAHRASALVEYRNRAYVEMSALLERLGPPPVE